MPADDRSAPSAFKYDVSFSFLTRDEGLAMQLNDLLQDRVQTFIYTERQKELAGTDGQETFTRVFREESRLVVVLYRAGWGETKWTRVEEAAIRARAFDHGFDFAKFIPLDEPAAVPRWLPQTQIYIGLRRFGLEGAAAVIEQRIRDLGGQAHQETIQERAQRIEREIAFEKRRAQFRREPGVASVNQQLPELKKALETQSASVKAIALKTGDRNDGFYLIGLGRALALNWRQVYFNTLEDAGLEVRLYSHLPPGPNQWMQEKPSVVKTLKFDFDLLPSGEGGWISTDPRRRSFSTDELAEHLLRFYLEHGRGAR